MDVLRRIPLWGALALLIYMPLHIFLSQSLSLTTGGLEAWKVGKDVVLLALTLFTICLVLLNRQSSRLFYWLLGLSVLYGALHLLLWAVNPEIFDKSAILGIVYNNRLPCLLLIGFGATVLNGDKFVFSLVIKVLLAMSTLVALLGIVQYFLPKDLLSHVGYGLERGTRVAFFIEDNPALPRIMSTLREPNALGAYLLLPITLLALLLARIKDQRRMLLGGLLLLHLLALFLTFSRSAWLATILAVLLVLCWQYKKMAGSLTKRYWPLAAALLLIVMVAVVAGRDTPLVQHYLIHSTQEEAEDLDSNDLHTKLIEEGVRGVVDRPLGHGPGTAGLASIQIPSGLGQLTENYYVQLAYEVGVFGLLIFVALNVVIYYHLRERRDWLGAVLLASFWGYVLMNMLLHTWSNEAVAAQWWLLAGVAVAATASGRSASTKRREVS